MAASADGARAGAGAGAGGAGGGSKKERKPKKPGVMQQLEDLIIRPPRAQYSRELDLLGGAPTAGAPGALFVLQGRAFCRVDRTLRNARGEALQLSYYHPAWWNGERRLPAVIYAHGNSGCRCDANDVAALLLPQNICVVALDFAGSGKSEGEYVTLGAREMEDLGAAKEWLMRRGQTSRVGLWGRSMGAVASLLCARQDPSVAGLVLDSIFSRLNDVAMELVRVSAPKLPGAIARSALYFMRRGIRRRAGFDISELDALSAAEGSWTPALFMHGEADTMIGAHHSRKVHAAYSGDKNLVTFEGDHNDARPQFAKDSASIFWYNTLQPPSKLENEVPGCAPHAKDLLFFSEMTRMGNEDAGGGELGSRGSSDADDGTRAASGMPGMFGVESLTREMQRHAETADSTRAASGGARPRLGVQGSERGGGGGRTNGAALCRSTRNVASDSDDDFGAMDDTDEQLLAAAIAMSLSDAVESSADGQSGA